MTDSERAAAGKWKPGREPARLLRPSKFSFVDSIKEGFRRISGCRELPEQAKKERAAQRMGVVGPAHPMDIAVRGDSSRFPHCNVLRGSSGRSWEGGSRELVSF